MLYRLQVDLFQYIASPPFSTGFCVTHKLATFPTSQYSQFFKRKVEVTMKFETNLSQEPVSTRKKETFVQCYILLYSIFLQKNWELLLPYGKICGSNYTILCNWRRICVKTSVFFVEIIKSLAKNSVKELDFLLKFRLTRIF